MQETDGETGVAKRILLVEDEPALASLMERYLNRQGYVVVARDTGETAWEEFQTDPGSYDLVIADLTLPGMAGDELINRILLLRPDTRVLVSSGTTAPAALLKRPGVTLLEKPFLPAALAESVQRALDPAG